MKTSTIFGDFVLCSEDLTCSAHGDEMRQPKVSVCMWTYNHEKYIAQAIESVLMQETDFECELIIGEDCSIDGTRAVVADYQKRYPDRIRAFLRRKNLGGYENSKQVLAAAHGQYIALLDGDDYWTSSHKLQKQVDLLENHPEYSMCFHRVAMVHDGQSSPVAYRGLLNAKPVIGFWEAVGSFAIQTCSVVCRNGYFDPLPDWYRTLKSGDYSLYLILSRHGSIGYLDETMSVYRLHSGGYWSTTTDEFQYLAILDALRLFRRLLPPDTEGHTVGMLAPMAMQVAQTHLAAGHRLQSIRWALACLKQDPGGRRTDRVYVARFIIGAMLGPGCTQFVRRLKHLR
jgi:glycosyltransferase involved in cell wall biosynthesis